MKRIFIVISILLLVSVASFSCGESSINCNKACDKIKQCVSTTDVASCKSTCGKWNQTLNDDVVSKLNSCINQTCDTILNCEAQAFQNCKTDLGGLFNKLCGQLQSCGGFVDTETCVNSLKDIEDTGAFNTLKCLDGGFLNSLASCVTNDSCDIPKVTSCIQDRTNYLSESSAQ